MSEPVILPRVPSALIRLALADLAKVEEDPRYVINMWDWHVPRGNQLCAVCLSGSVMAKTLDADISREVDRADFYGNEDQLLALDYFRRGAADEAIEHLGIFRGDVYWSGVTSYSTNPIRFRADMNAMADRFERMGL